MNTKLKKIYPIDEWRIVEKEFNIENNELDETIFALGNGHIGMRGNFEEGYSGPSNTTLPGTYINGFYETHPIMYGEPAYGFAKNGETMLNVTDSKIIELIIDGEIFNMLTGEILSYRRTLDMKKGLLERKVTWRSPKGKEVYIKITRMIALTHKNLVMINYQVTPLNFNGEIKIISALNGDVRNQEALDDPRVGTAMKGQILKLERKEQIENNISFLEQYTEKSSLILICGMKNDINTDCEYQIEKDNPNQRVEDIFIINGKQDEKITLNKYISYFTSRDEDKNDLEKKTIESLNKWSNIGFDKLQQEQIEYLNNYWDKSMVEIEGDPYLQQGIRFNQFHLLQSVGRDGKTNISAKGLTGEGYEGHYFWDTEIYIFPYFLYTNPEISRKLLEYRYSILPAARKRARELGHPKGALYPWRTITGQECSAYFPAGTAQYHINADIIYALRKYIEATDDMDFLINYGSEMAFETARAWADLGDYIEGKGNKFCINSVTGPDEYTAIVNNNFYTNYMAKLNLEYAYDIATMMKREYPYKFDWLCKKINLSLEEIEAWKKAADNMYLPYDEKLKIHSQDDSFLDKEKWDFENVPKENYPLLLHYHPLVIYRYQVLKQADVVLALLLLGDKFTLDQKKRDYDYYEKITTHDSSLSTCIYSIIANEIGYEDKAYQYFMNNARMDLDNIQNNSEHGIHTAAMAGTWMGVVYGFAGMRVYDGKLNFNPNIPTSWESCKFKITFKGKVLQVEINKDRVVYSLIEGKELEFNHKEENVKLDQGNEIKFDIIK